MKLLYFSNEFPNDDVQELYRGLTVRSKDRQHPLLARFIEDATSAVKEELWSLSATQRALFPTFESVFELADYPQLRKGPLCGSVDGVLLCVLQLATLIGYLEEHPDEFALDPEDTQLAGLGTGLLASAAVALSPTLAELPWAAAEVIRVAFRMGVHVDEVSWNLEPRDVSGAAPDSWASVIPGIDPEDVRRELEAHCARERIPQSGKIFVSALSKTSVTISGPPSRLKALFRDHDFFRDRQFVNLPVYGGLCHAPHVYNQDDVQAVVHTRHMEALGARLAPRLPVLCTSSGLPYEVETATELFEAIVWELMGNAIEWDQVVAGLADTLQSTGDAACEVVVFRKSQAVNDLLAGLQGVLPDLATTTRDLIAWAARKGGDDLPANGPRGPMQSKIAIVGMACRLPGGATDTEKFWELLEKGLDVHRKIPADRFDIETHFDPSGKSLNKSQTEYGCFIDEPGLFDAPFFNMSPKEAMQTDPQGRLALVTAFEALERAGYVPNRTSATHLHRVGTFYGQAADDYREVNQGQEVGTYYIPGGCRAFVPGRINYFFKFWGPSFSIDTACSSSLATIQAACTSLWAGDCDTAVTGGVNVLTNCDGFAGLSQGHFLTKGPNACKTWDVLADGYCRADAIGSLVLKRLEDAEADNDNILGVILSAATNHSAEAVSITHPLAEAQSELTRKVMHRAGVDPLDVGFVEMHGTGTQAGDMEEIKSVTDVFAPNGGGQRRRTSKQPLYIGAVKSNVGHSESAAGVTALLKVLLMFQKEAIPPHVGIKNSLTPKFPKDMDKRNVQIPFERTAWPRTPGRKRIAVVNNFSAAGGNTSIALEEPPVRQPAEGSDPRPSHVVTVGAKSKKSLEGNLRRHLAFLAAHGDDTSLGSLSYTTTARRHHYNYRVTVCAQDLAQVRKQLEASLAGLDAVKPIPGTGGPSVAFAFTGQGASHQSMNQELYRDCPFYRAQIQQLDALARGQGFASFVPALDGSFPQDHTHSPVVTQLALVCTEIALARYWTMLGLQPSVVIGHSLGEYAAMHVAGVLSAADIIYLVGRRAQLLEERCVIGSHKMMAVSATLDEIERGAAGRPYEVACINGPRQIVLSGPREDIDALGEVLKAAGHRAQCLEVAFAFHSAQTDAILDEFEAIAKKAVVFREPNVPYVSPLLRRVVCDGKTINANYLRRATREAVDFVGALEAAQRQHMIDEKLAWVEMGPHPVCMGFVKASLPASTVTVASMRRGQNNWTTLADGLAALHAAGVELNWNEFHRPFERHLRLLDLPTYAWNDKTYWMQYTGDWCLTKGNTHYAADSDTKAGGRANGEGALPKSSLRTSSVQDIWEEEIGGHRGRVTMQSDLMQQDFFAAAHGHGMNGCGVVTSSIHADIAYTLGEYLYRKLRPDAGKVDMNVANLNVVKGLVAQKYIKTPQLMRVTAEIDDVRAGVAQLQWYNVRADGTTEEPFATAQLLYGDAGEWLSTWASMAHLIRSRVEALQRMCDEGRATRFSHTMAYRLFANNLVDYADKYRGMQSVVLHELEAFADVVLSHERSGTWTIPPQYIDSVAHLAGFVMNCSDAVDTRASFCVTPGWRSMRFAARLEAGARYRSYVKMLPTAEDPSVFMGDVYILQGDDVVGMVGGITFRKYPRILLDRFFSPPDAEHARSSSAQTQKPKPKPAGAAAPSASTSTARPPAAAAAAQPRASITVQTTAPASDGGSSSGTSTPQEAMWSPSTTESCSQPPTPKTSAPGTKPEAPGTKAAAAAAAAPDAAPAQENSTVSKAMELIAKEAALDVEDLVGEASFASLGVDSLMSLVIAEKFRDELGVQVSGGLFLEYPTINDLRSWLVEYYS